MPLCSLTSILPSGRNDSDHGDDRPVVTVSTVNCVLDFRAGASVWPGKAGVGLVITAGVCSSAVKVLGGDFESAGAVAAMRTGAAKPNSDAAIAGAKRRRSVTILLSVRV